MKRLRKLANKYRRQRGSALLVSLMVMVGLSLLGLGFVAITETESGISVNERNTAQALAGAETGARAVVEWFQDTDWSRDRDLLPGNLNAFKTERRFPANPGLDGYYKPNATSLLFDKPYKGDVSHRFYGDGDLNPPTADVWIYRGKNADSDTFLQDLNTALFMPDSAHREWVRISDIRVYAPPVPGATRNANGFWEGGAARYGVATIRVTAQKVTGTDCYAAAANCRVVAERNVKSVLAETPFPTVDGAIETSGTLVGQGNFHVYWGKVLSEKDIRLARPAYGMPWVDAKNYLPFEYGYDSARPREANKLYVAGALYSPDGDVVMANATALAADSELLKFSYKATAVTGNTDPGDPGAAAWPKVIDQSWTDGGVTWTAIASKPFPFDADFYHSADWRAQLIDRQLEDPWLHVRARQDVTYHNSGIVPCSQPLAPHPCDYNNANLNPASRYSNFFQWQITTDPGDRPDRVEVVFPTMDYEFWKAVAQSGNNENGVYYFKYADPVANNHNEFIGPAGQRKHISEWINAMKNGLGAGFYFFDTRNSKNPQFNRGGTLTPSFAINAAVGGPFQLQGYVYLNAENFGTTGAGNAAPIELYAMPGEPFRDVGYREVDDSIPADLKFRLEPSTGTLPSADYVIRGRGNGIWDFQDVKPNLKFDIFLKKVTTLDRPDGSSVTDAWVPVPFFEGCTPGDNDTVGANCSEPHEPYVNFIYPDITDAMGAATVGWSDPTVTGATVANFRKPKVRSLLDPNVPGVTCTDISSQAECTSNAYDEDGAMVRLQPYLWGALYNEGGYDGSGNVYYYGALLMRSHFRATGTPHVFFNECLARGCLEDQLKLQRVTTTSWQTD
ncbi:MAG TPA: hypothetical protein VNA04_17960 [Thermoanaerobaculia bacterium]|nr:hypothetical protein [Thermoanaerobaculia bacterium]